MAKKRAIVRRHPGQPVMFVRAGHPLSNAIGHIAEVQTRKSWRRSTIPDYQVRIGDRAILAAETELEPYILSSRFRNDGAHSRGNEPIAPEHILRLVESRVDAEVAAHPERHVPVAPAAVVPDPPQRDAALARGHTTVVVDLAAARTNRPPRPEKPWQSGTRIYAFTYARSGRAWPSPAPF